MRNCGIVLTLICICLLALGCERRKASESPPAVHYGDAVPQAGVLDSTPSDDLLADQASISRRMERQRLAAAAEGATTPSESGAAGREPIEQVRQMLSGILADVQAGQKDRVLDVFTDEAKAELRPLMTKMTELPAKVQAFEELVSTKLGLEMPEGFKEGLAVSVSGLGISTDLGFSSLDELTFSQAGQDVIVGGIGMGPRDLTFSLVRSEYRASLPPEATQLILVLGDLFAAQEKFIDDLTDGLNNGEITAANLQTKIEEIGNETFTPIMAKVMALVMPTADEGGPEATTEGEEETAEPTSDSDQPSELEGTLRRITNPTEGAED